jgi:hypothetical protein
LDAVDDVKMPALSRSVMVKSERWLKVKYGCNEWVALNLGWMIYGRRFLRCGPNQETAAVLSIASGWIKDLNIWRVKRHRKN